jgi:LPXTG-motif cell wall-anchored protein
MIIWLIQLKNNNQTKFEMKKYIIIFSVSILVFYNGITVVVGQDQPKPKKDTVNLDTDAKPKFYYAIEDEQPAKKQNPVKRNSPQLIIIAGIAAVGVVAGYFLLKKKK